GGKRRIESRGAASVSANSLHPYTQNVALFSEKLGTLFHESWRVRSIFVEIDVLLRVRALGPSRAQQDPGAGGDVFLQRLPLFYALGGEEENRIFCHVGRYVNHTGRADGFLLGGILTEVFRQILGPAPTEGRGHGWA